MGKNTPQRSQLLHAPQNQVGYHQPRIWQENFAEALPAGSRTCPTVSETPTTTSLFSLGTSSLIVSGRGREHVFLALLGLEHEEG